jgi:O-antigen ligase
MTPPADFAALPRRPPARASASLGEAGGRERIAGAALALFLVSGSWSLARVAGVEPLAIWQPRVWAVAILVAMALLPGPRRPRLTPSALLPELAWLGFSLLAVTWAPDLLIARDQGVDLVLLIAVALALHRLGLGGQIEVLAASLRTGLLVLLLGLAAMALLGGVGGGRLAVLGGGPNVFGRNMGLLCVLALERALDLVPRPISAAGSPRRSGLVGWAVVACVAAGLVALSGSRGAMISSFVAVSLLLTLGRARLGRRLAVALGVLGLFLALLLFTSLGARVSEAFATRVLDLLFVDRYVSSRDRIYVFALEAGAARPLVGHGIGSFAASTPWPYAHNIMLDAWYETGVVGVALLGLYLGRSARVLAWLGSHGREVWLAAAVLIFVGAQFSGGRYDCRGLLVFTALALALPPRGRAALAPVPPEWRPA